MTDDRFFRRSGPFTLADLARHVGATLSSNAPPDFSTHGIASLDKAAEGQVSLFSDTKHRDNFKSGKASAVVTSTALSKHAPEGAWLILTDNPRLAFAQIGHLFYPQDPIKAGVHANAVVDPTAQIGKGSSIASGAVVGAKAIIGARCRIGCNVVIAEGVVLGDDCEIGANTTISHAIIGNRVRISTNVSIGGEGFGFVPGPGGPLRVPQLGRVLIGDNIEIGGNCAIDRGGMDDTEIGAGTVIDNLVHIAHSVKIGRFCVIAGQIGIAGSSTLGDMVMMGGQVGINDHLTIGSRVRIAAKSGVIHDIPEGETFGGYPAVPIRQWHRQTVAIGKLGKLKPE